MDPPRLSELVALTIRKRPVLTISRTGSAGVCGQLGKDATFCIDCLAATMEPLGK